MLESPNDSPKSSLEDQIGFQLRLAQLSVFADIIDSLKPLELRPTDMAVLMMIAANPNRRQQAIGEALRIQKPNVVALIDTLEKRGLIARTVDVSDRRANLLELTPSGHDILQQALTLQEAHRQRLLKTLDGLDVDNFMACLRRLSDL